jgi:hypothetical protein
MNWMSPALSIDRSAAADREFLSSKVAWIRRERHFWPRRSDDQAIALTTRREPYRNLSPLAELGIQIRRFINTLYLSAGVTIPKTEENFDFGRAFFLIGCMPKRPVTAWLSEKSESPIDTAQ